MKSNKKFDAADDDFVIYLKIGEKTVGQVEYFSTSHEYHDIDAGFGVIMSQSPMITYIATLTDSTTITWKSPKFAVVSTKELDGIKAWSEITLDSTKGTSVTIGEDPSPALRELYGITPGWGYGMNIVVTETKDSVELVSTNFDSLSDFLPGMQEKVGCPESVCPWSKKRTYELKLVIMHLNDHHGWLREEIADWLDILDIDLYFKVDLEQPTLEEDNNED